MKRILLLIFFIVALWLGVKIAHEPGYIFIAYNYWTVEMPLWLGIVLLAIIFLILHSVFRLFYHTRRIGRYWQFSTKKRRTQRALEKTYYGFLDVLNGKFKKGEKKLSHAANDSPLSLINYLNAAKAAFLQKAYGRSQDYFDKALAKEPQASVAIGTAKAALEIENHNWERALVTLSQLNEQAPQNPNVLMLLKEVYQHLKNWSGLVALLPRLRKSPLETRDSINEIEEQAYLGLLNQANKEVLSSQDLHAVWESIPRHFQQDPKFIYCYAESLEQLHESLHAEVLLKRYLRHHWDESLISLYGKIAAEQPAERFRFAEKLLKHHSESATLLLCLGRLATRAKLWGKAKYYLEMSIKHAPSVESYELLGRVLEQLNDKEAAFAMYRKGAVIASETDDLHSI